MFSARTNWQSRANPLMDLLARKNAAGEPILDLTESNPTRCGIHYPARRILGALSQPAALEYRPSPRGLLSAREAVSQYYAQQHLNAPPDSLFLTASTSEGYGYLLKLLTNPGDEILVPNPGYPLLDFLSGLENVKHFPYRLRYRSETGWAPDLTALENSLSTRSRAIVVVSPNNPTGNYLKKNELDELARICREHNLTLIADEVFAEFPAGKRPAGFQRTAGFDRVLTFTLNGFSKMLGLPQLKLGWIQVSGPPEVCREAVHRLEIIADTYLSVSAPVQVAAPQLLKMRAELGKQMGNRLRGNEAALLKQLSRGGGLQMLKREGGWYAVLKLEKSHSDEEWSRELLENQNVFVHPGYFYDFPQDGFMVLSLLTRPEIFSEGVEKLLDWVTN